MKQIAKTGDVLTRLQRAVGADVSVENLSVYEAIALNTRPLRKRHPLYQGAIAERSMLLEMAARLDIETAPLQTMHDGSALPIGRVFFGEVVEKSAETELRVLFFVDKQHTNQIAAIDNGTVDQVSVGVLPKKMICSADGFDFLGPDASFENVYSGTTPDGHVVGQNGVFCRMVGLDQWFEMSLVGMGGAQNARIVNSDQSHFSANLQRLAASGATLDHLALTATATTDEDKMDISSLTAALTTSVADAATLKATNATLEAQVATLTAEKTTLQTRVIELEAGAPALVAANAQVATLTAEKTETAASLSAADTALRDVLKKVLVASGQTEPQLPENLTEVISQITEKSAALAAALSNGGKALDANSGAGEPALAPQVGAFRARR